MPSLSEFIGAIVQETAKARMLADLESIRMAETYYQDMYLKHLPVPHFKMPEVTIEMPVAVSQIVQPNSSVTNSSLLNNMKMRINSDLKNFMPRALLALKQDVVRADTLTLRTLPTRLSKMTGTEETALTNRMATSCQSIVDTVFKNKDYSNVNSTPLRLTKLADDMEIMLSRELAANYLDFVGDKKGGVNEEAMRSVLRMAREMMMDSITIIMKADETSLSIVSDTTDLVQLGDIKYLTTIKVTMHEQDYVWSIGESDVTGVEERHLVIE